ncbi:4-(cytidine 5'-diphospho)-2-C-methyl-D-erythritol kinase [Candidatus Roizmanbacteria bacterium]|nr:4-(cytidine 5'-diphospho)-2-C-methyl-D-erythritol kinase [Candidatus Roizmanbacteria bacterium]
MIREKAWAKLNLNLHVLPKRGYNALYPVHFINCQLDLHDELLFKKNKNGIEIVWQNPQVPKEKNLIYKAAMLLKKEVSTNGLGSQITLKKIIPVKAGFGGGSSDASKTLKGLMKLWKIDLPFDTVLNFAKHLGKDVYYCLQEGLCEVCGYGEQVSQLLYRLPTLWLLIVVPKQEKPSTQWMYEHLDPKKIGKNLDKLEKLKSALKLQNREKLLDSLFNDFEDLAELYFPEVKYIKKKLYELGAVRALMAGSGLSMIGFFKSQDQLGRAYCKLVSQHKAVLQTKTR